MEYQQVNTYNANRPHGFGRLDPEAFTPYPKNPVIGAFFREIDRADELGSGMRNIMKYGRKYGGVVPQLIEVDIFRMIISVSEFGAVEKPGAARGKQYKIHDEAHDEAHDGAQVTPEAAPEVTPEVKSLLSVLQAEMKRKERMTALGLKDQEHFRQRYQQLGIALGIIEMTISDKPKSSKQKYRLTSKGKKILEKME